MKSRLEIQENFEVLCDKRLKNRYKKLLARTTKNCCYSQCYGVNDGENSVVLCQPEINDKKLFICNDDICAKCKSFDLKKTKKEIEEEFMNDMSNPQICGQKEPKIAVLLWVLQEEKKLPEEKSHWLKNIFQLFGRKKKKLDGSV